jgi:tetratricopeptide (TPR) repeat protein
MSDDTEQHKFQNQINLILEKASFLIKEKKYKEAAAIVEKGLKTYPKQKDLLDLFEEIKKQYKNEKIQKLQDEAIIFMRAGAEDKAQEKLRQILQLDPTRTDLKESFQKSRAEVIADYNYRTERMQLIRLGSMVLLTIVVILCSIALWAWWSNDRYLKKSEKFIASGELYNARQALKKCGWFLAGKKQKVNEELRSAVNELINQANHYAELKDFQAAKQYLESAALGAENSSQIKEQIKKYDQLEQQWQEEQEKQKVLSQKALVAKEEFQRALEQSLGNKADIEAKNAIEIAKNKAQAAENLFNQNQFESAEKQWLSAIEDCKTALKIAETAEVTKTNKTIVSAFKLKCEQAAASALKINAPAEASEIWQEAEKIRNSAEQNFTQNDFNAAGQLWQQATDKYDEAIKECPSYKKALLMQKKWLQLKQGSSDEYSWEPQMCPSSFGSLYLVLSDNSSGFQTR